MKALVDTCTIHVQYNLGWTAPRKFNPDEVRHQFSVKITIPPNSKSRMGVTESMTLRYKENCTREINDANLSVGRLIPDLVGTIS